MTDWPATPLLYPPSPIISVATRHSLGGGGGLAGTNTSLTWPAANRAILTPFRLSGRYTAQRMFWVNSNTTGTADAGIYDPSGTRLGSVGSATARTGAVQGAALSAPVQLDAGLYYFALLCSSASGTFLGVSLSAGFITPQCVGMASVDVGAATLPATLTLAAYTDAIVPLVGMSAYAGVP
jgi:hypothetical protein